MFLDAFHGSHLIAKLLGRQPFEGALRHGELTPLVESREHNLLAALQHVSPDMC